MSKITKIHYAQHRDKYWIYTNGEYCASIRARTFKGMDLFVGQEITCAEVKEMENYHWKNSYGKAAWEKEKVRIDRVIALLESVNKQIIVNVTGFGADTTDLIKTHPEEAGKPDLEVLLDNDRQLLIMQIEVTGTEMKRGSDYWIRPDKLEYCRNHPDENVWVILHYAQPSEQFVFIKPDNQRQYQHTEKVIRDSVEFYIVFDDASPETKTLAEFTSHLNALVV